MKGIDKLEGQFLATKLAVIALITLHPRRAEMPEALAFLRKDQAERGLFSQHSDDALKACDDMLALLTKIARGEP